MPIRSPLIPERPPPSANGRLGDPAAVTKRRIPDTSLSTRDRPAWPSRTQAERPSHRYQTEDSGPIHDGQGQPSASTGAGTDSRDGNRSTAPKGGPPDSAHAPALTR